MGEYGSYVITLSGLCKSSKIKRLYKLGNVCTVKKRIKIRKETKIMGSACFYYTAKIQILFCFCLYLYSSSSLSLVLQTRQILYFNKHKIIIIRIIMRSVALGWLCIICDEFNYLIIFYFWFLIRSSQFALESN